MIRYKGTGLLARRSERLPIRARVGLVLIAAQLAVNDLRNSKNYATAHDGFELARRWYDGERIDPDLIEDALAHEYNKGVMDSQLEAESAREKLLWSILADALLYTAFHATHELGAPPSSVIGEVDENILDELEDHLRALSQTAIDVLFRSADLLSRHPAISFAQLKSALLQPE